MSRTTPMCAGIAALILACGNGAAAQNESAPDMTQAGPAIAERLYISPMASYTFADSARNADDGFGWALALGKQINRYFNVEASGFVTEFDAENGGGSQDLSGYGLSGMVFPLKRLPSLFGLIAGHYVDESGQSDSVAFDFGLGYLIGPIKFFNYGSLRAEARYRRSSVDQTVGQGGNTDLDEPVINLGVLIPLGAAPLLRPPPPVEPIAVVAPLAACADGIDNDGDGLIDFPGDPGCSGADDNDETDPPQCSDGKDNDGDGLIDFPNDKGCTSAEDVDETDPCKTPEVGEKVSLRGCGTGDVIVLRGVNFEFDKASLTTNARTLLDGVAEELVAYPDIRIELGGHTDAKGSDEYNQSLSERRAASVVKYLVSRGVAADRMTAAGYGEAAPVADNQTDEGRELNRRVELKITAGVAQSGAADPPAGA